VRASPRPLIKDRVVGWRLSRTPEIAVSPSAISEELERLSVCPVGSHLACVDVSRYEPESSGP